MRFKHVLFWVTNVFVVMILVGGCTRITVSEEEELAAERFEPAPGFGNVYIVREKTLSGSLVDIDVTINDQHIGPINIGTYHLMELRPGRYIIAAYANKADHKKSDMALEVAEAENHFIQVEPVFGFRPKASVELIDADLGQRMVIKGSRLISNPVEF